MIEQYDHITRDACGPLRRRDVQRTSGQQRRPTVD